MQRLKLSRNNKYETGNTSYDCSCINCVTQSYRFWLWSRLQIHSPALHIAYNLIKLRSSRFTNRENVPDVSRQVLAEVGCRDFGHFGPPPNRSAYLQPTPLALAVSYSHTPQLHAVFGSNTSANIGRRFPNWRICVGARGKEEGSHKIVLNVFLCCPKFQSH